MSWLSNFLGIGRASLVDDSGDLQLIQVTEGAVGKGFAARVTDKVRRVTEFGFSSNPPIDAEIVVLRRSGDRTRSIIIGTSHRPSRPKNLGPGDTMIYDVRGAYIWLKDGSIEIEAKDQDILIKDAGTVTVKASDKVRVEAPMLDCTGDVRSRVDGTPVSLNDLRDAFHAHKHLGVTGSPGTTDHDA